MSEVNDAPVAAEVQPEAVETEVETQAEPTETPEPQSSKRKFKLKVDGEEFEDELDLSNEQEVIKRLQLQKVAQKRMEESNLTRRQVESLVEALKSNPFEVLEKIGIDPRELSEGYLSKMLEEQMLTPEEKENREAKRIIDEHKRQMKEQEEQREQQEMQQLEARYTEEYQKTIIDALEASGLPKSKRSMQRIVQAMRANIQRGTKFDPKIVAKMAREDYEQEVQEIVSSFQDDDQLINFFGGAAERIRKADLKRVQKAPKSFTPPQKTQVREDKPQPKLSMAEWRKLMESK